MAFTIRIYETNEYIYSLLKKRLGSFYPDAYIVNPCLKDRMKMTGSVTSQKSFTIRPALTKMISPLQQPHALG